MKRLFSWCLVERQTYFVLHIFLGLSKIASCSRFCWCFAVDLFSWFHVLDLEVFLAGCGCHQINLEENSRLLTTFKSNRFSYRFLSMSQGLHTSPATMQNAVNLIFENLLNNGVNVYIDDILIYTDNIKDDISLLEKFSNA